MLPSCGWSQLGQQRSCGRDIAANSLSYSRISDDEPWRGLAAEDVIELLPLADLLLRLIIVSPSNNPRPIPAALGLGSGAEAFSAVRCKLALMPKVLEPDEVDAAAEDESSSRMSASLINALHSLTRRCARRRCARCRHALLKSDRVARELPERTLAESSPSVSAPLLAPPPPLLSLSYCRSILAEGASCRCRE